MKNAYIIMGDVISSRNHQAAGLMDGMQNLINTTNKRWENNLLSPLTVTLGDEFQGAGASLAGAIGVLLSLEETSLKEQAKFEFRYVVHYGVIETEINTDRAHGMLGEGLTRARELLDSKNKKYRFTISLDDSFKSTSLTGLFKVLDGIKGKWNLNNYPLIYDMIHKSKDNKVADIHGKNASQVWKMRRNNLIQEYRELKEVINMFIEQ